MAADSRDMASWSALTYLSTFGMRARRIFIFLAASLARQMPRKCQSASGGVPALEIVRRPTNGRPIEDRRAVGDTITSLGSPRMNPCATDIGRPSAACPNTGSSHRRHAAHRWPRLGSKFRSMPQRRSGNRQGDESSREREPPNRDKPIIFLTSYDPCMISPGSVPRIAHRAMNPRTDTPSERRRSL